MIVIDETIDGDYMVIEFNAKWSDWENNFDGCPWLNEALENITPFSEGPSSTKTVSETSPPFRNPVNACPKPMSLNWITGGAGGMALRIVHQVIRSRYIKRFIRNIIARFNINRPFFRHSGPLREAAGAARRAR